MKFTLLSTAVTVTLSMAFTAVSAGSFKLASSNIIVDWNLITVKATKIAGYNSNLGSRIEAIEAIAVYDAVNSIKHIGAPYHYFHAPSGAASTQAAVAQATQFRSATPPDIGTDAYKKALAEVAEIGVAGSATRTTDQTHIAQFYKQDAELTVNEAARILIANHNFSLEENAYIFLLKDIAEADARIAIWDGKYTYLLWRPVTALNADPDGVVTNNYTVWTPLLSTPPHPSYPCGHCGTVTAGFEVLKKFFGDKNTLELHTSTAGEPARTVLSLSDGESENGWSRIYGGIHYSLENDAAQDLGRKVAAFVLTKGPKAKVK